MGLSFGEDDKGEDHFENAWILSPLLALKFFDGDVLLHLLGVSKMFNAVLQRLFLQLHSIDFGCIDEWWAYWCGAYTLGQESESNYAMKQHHLSEEPSTCLQSYLVELVAECNKSNNFQI